MINKNIRKAGKILSYIIGVVLLLLCIAIFFIYTPWGKKVVRNRVQSYMENKLKTKVVIGAVDYSLPEWLELKNVYIEDRNKDTLLFGEQLSVDLSMFKLITGTTDI